MEKRTYGLFTAITMIVGIVVGSGIFFKADDVLLYANGNVLLGVLIFILAATAIIFGSLTISQLATRTDKPGGIVTYTEDFVGLGAATVIGWFQTFLYLPALAAVVAWVSGVYISTLMGYEEMSITRNTIIGFIVITVLYIINVLSAKLGGYFQNCATIIKLIPLVAFAVLGLIFGNPATTISESASSFAGNASSLGWVAAFAPVAFSFDGWIIATSICNEIKNSKKNLPLALSIAPIVVLVVYVAYFLGITSYLGVDEVIAGGDSSVYLMADKLLGAFGAKVVLIIVIISVIGTVNGICLGTIRMPYSMAIRNMMPGSKLFAKESKKSNGTFLNSALLTYALTIFYLLIHHCVTTTGIMGSHDISEIAICMLYLFYILLYVAVIRLYKKGEIKSKFVGIVMPILAICGSLIIFSGAVTSSIFLVYLAICLLFMGVAYLYYRKNKSIIK